MSKHFFRFLQIGLLGLGFNFLNTAWADPWFTGPLLAPSGHTIRSGHTNLEVYFFDRTNNGFYTRHGVISLPDSRNIVGSPIFSHGLMDNVDFQFGIPYVYNKVPGAYSSGFGDATLNLGYQLIEQKKSDW